MNQPIETDMTPQTRTSGRTREGASQSVRALLGAVVILLALGTVLGIAGAAAKSNLRRGYPAPCQLVDVGGSKMHLSCMGRGTPTVILEAGLDDFSIFWVLVQPEAAKSTRVCAYDRAGLGWSESSGSPRTIGNMAGELHSLLEAAKIDKPVVLAGHSFGGALVRMYAHEYPEEVVGMVLVDATHEDLFARIPAWQKPTGQMIGLYNTLAPVSSFGLLALAPQNIPNRGLPGESLAQFRAIAATTGYFQSANDERKAFEGNLAGLRAAGVEDLGNIPLTVLSRGIWEPPLPGLSEEDNQQAWRAWQEMQRELALMSSNSQHIVAGKSGHHIQLQQPELVIEAIRQVVQTIDQ
jgi:pimeloyl-ACP methyl ester carboxylesterase